MAKRLEGSEKSIFEQFGIDLETGKVRSVSVTHDMIERLSLDPTAANIKKARATLIKNGYPRSEIDEYRVEFPSLFSGWDPFLPAEWSKGKIAAVATVSVALP